MSNEQGNAPQATPTEAEVAASKAGTQAERQTGGLTAPGPDAQLHTYLELAIDMNAPWGLVQLDTQRPAAVHGVA